MKWVAIFIVAALCAAVVWNENRSIDNRESPGMETRTIKYPPRQAPIVSTPTPPLLWSTGPTTNYTALEYTTGPIGCSAGYSGYASGGSFQCTLDHRP